MSAHYRNDCISNIDPVTEMIRVAQQIPMKFQISHLSSRSAMGLMQESLEAINCAMEKNPRLDYDTYPYNAFSTHMGSAVFEDGCLEDWKKDYSDILLTDDPYKDVRRTKEIFEKVRVEYPDMLGVAFVMNEEEIAAAIANQKRHGCQRCDYKQRERTSESGRNFPEGSRQICERRQGAADN